MIKAVYKIESVKTGQAYIGSTVNFASRMNVHIELLVKNEHFNKQLQKHFNKYGLSDLHFSVIENFEDDEKMRKSEIKFIKNSKNLFNIHNNSNSNKNFLNEVREDIILLLIKEGYTQEDIAYMLRDADRSTISRIINKRPSDWKPKWVKQG